MSTSVELLVIKNIKDFLSQRNMNQSTLARRSKMPDQSLCKILKGQRSPSLKTLEKIACALECKVGELISENPTQSNEITKEYISELIAKAIEDKNLKEVFRGLKVSPYLLIDVVERFGGWDFLYNYLVEELAIRNEAEIEYKKFKEEFELCDSNTMFKQAKRKMIISKLIEKANMETLL